MKLTLFHIVALAFILSNNVVAQVTISKDTYNFPPLDSLTSTITSLSIRAPKDASWEELKLVPIERSVGGKKVFAKVRLHSPKPYCRNKNKSLVFIHAGIASDATASTANFYANEISKECQYSLIIPSIFNKDFIVAMSRSGVIGDGQKDIQDLFDFMKYAQSYLQRNNNLYFDNYSLMGYSLGALSSAFLAKIDHNQKFFNFKKVLLINSPVNLHFGMKVIDRYIAHLNSWKWTTKYKEIVRLTKNVLTYRRHDPSSTTFNDFKKLLSHLSLFEKEALIGRGLAHITSNLIKFGQKTMQSIFEINLELKTNKGYSFNSYLSEIFIPFKQLTEPGSTPSLELHNSKNSLTALEDFLHNSENIYLMHNKDDFLLKQSDIPYLKKVFKNRVYLYPRGGHMGNTWFKKNVDDMKMILGL